jgi:hypothetical protein
MEPNQGTLTGNDGSTSGIKLTGLRFVLGTTNQAEVYTRTVEMLADRAGIEISKEMRPLILDGVEAAFDEPDIPDDDAGKAAFEKYRMQLKMYLEDERQYEKDKSKLFQLIMQCCDKIMRETVEGSDEYHGLAEKDNVVGLLALIKHLAFGGQVVQYEYWTMQAQWRVLVMLTQSENESIHEFAKRFLAQLKATEHAWGALVPRNMKGKPTADQDGARDKFLACLFLAGVNRKLFKDVIDELHNDFITGVLSYPEDLTTMVTLLNNRRGGTGKKSQAIENVQDGRVELNFAQGSETMWNGKCFYCKEKGHTKAKCPKRKAAQQKKADNNAPAEGQVHFQWTD